MRSILILTFLICFTVVSLSAAIFVIAFAGHDERCFEGCTLCPLFNQAKKLLEQLAVVSLFAGVYLIALFLTMGFAPLEKFVSNLVKSKTRMNN